ncbi:hypothetical protein AKJ16_DCAP03515 [Drosera capensis]
MASGIRVLVVCVELGKSGLSSKVGSKHDLGPGPDAESYTDQKQQVRLVGPDLRSSRPAPMPKAQFNLRMGHADSEFTES